MKKLKATAILLLSLILVLSLTACGGLQESYSYKLYYIGTEGSSLVPIGYNLSGKDLDEEGKIEELIKSMTTPVSNAKGSLPPLGANISLRKFSLNKKNLTLDFDAGYLDLQQYDELAIRAAVVKTLCQLEEVDSVTFTVNDAVLQDASGNAVGSMTSESFASISNDLKADKKTVDVKLYFSNLKGDELILENRKAEKNSSESMERIVIEQLMEGAKSKEAIGIMPKNTKLISVTVSDSVCFVNFDRAFAKGAAGIAPETTIYGIVNSLVELPNVNKVHISIESDSDRKYMETISLNQNFGRNLDLIQEEGNEK